MQKKDITVWLHVLLDCEPKEKKGKIIEKAN
jgi:hypothetical protein